MVVQRLLCVLVENTDHILIAVLLCCVHDGLHQSLYFIKFRTQYHAVFFSDA